MSVFFACIACLVALDTAAQKIENLKATFADGKVIINYDLTGDKANQKYNIDIYSSHNAFLNPLSFVSGDVGKNVSGGANKRILWEAGKELGTFKGELSFKVKVEVLPLPFQFIAPTTNGSVRRGKGASILWEGGLTSQTVKLEVYRGNNLVASVADTKNTGEYGWSVPKDFEKGKDYSLHISDGRQSVTSEAFTVKAKIPLLLKLSPLIIGAAIIPFLGGSGGGETTTPESAQLAGAPNPN